MFKGTHTPRLDEKGRLILPAKFRDQLSEGLVITKGQDRCLYVFTTEEFEAMYEGMRAAPLGLKASRDYTRVFLSAASDEVPDKQGRFTVPPMLRAYAGLDRDVAVVGAGSRVEIWDLQVWQGYLDEVEPAFAAQAEEVLPGLF
ncbi:division/cell wall cluster transcriptional repressor MraZ [Kineococcus gynurae]|uniref:Transcriptional regulator MraZ n=1 Tax=Kineococcus gynurae TaxID=452979 RepID=A0ABV5LXR7_9ACTN